jgi:hypothetical protein
MASRFGDESAVEFVAFFTSEKSGRRFVVANFLGQRFRVTLADVGRVADDEIEREWRVARTYLINAPRHQPMYLRG